MRKKATKTSVDGSRVLREQGARFFGKLLDFNRDRSVLRNPVSQFCDAHDLSSPQSHVIIWLGHEGPLNTRTLSRLADIHDKSITGVVDRLEARGLVERKRHPSDRRTVVNALTREGQSIYGGIRERIETALAGFFATLTPEDLETVFRLMDRLHDTVRVSPE
ncbi:MarR family transcriptional regulator [Myxococcus sp. K38C18041901]|uniref:MarR family winged helix-turn-helix transcriptional regulator n=1 Tax=Myxococcus guangdongensis TaxID=2906760 RepID=UPI0020A6EC3D|nr:MarR family transcriptional regulator [Myxococcus guangdongensis]MCP3059935.1 MarR family transcriptional regulator [Myxococcus guangdongensis]